MPLEKLENLVRTHQLSVEPPVQGEIAGLLRAARAKFKDALKVELTLESRAELGYSAAHAFALAALRWHGYCSDNRYLVFQCLVHTVGFSATQARVLSEAHDRRNRAAYEGETEVTQAQVDAVLSTSTQRLWRSRRRIFAKIRGARRRHSQGYVADEQRRSFAKIRRLDRHNLCVEVLRVTGGLLEIVERMGPVPAT